MTVSEQIIQVLDALCDKFNIVIDWTSSDVLPYLGTLCNKLISYEIWTSVAWIAIMLMLSIVTTILLVVFRRQIKEIVEDFDIFGLLLILFVGTIYISSIGVIGTQIFDIIKCVTFPEMYVFEYVQGLINGTH